MPRTKQTQLTRKQKGYLRSLFPKDSRLFEPEETWIYGVDASRLFEPPWAVVRPKSVKQVQDLLIWANREKIPIYPRACGTNVVGDCVPRSGGIVVSTLKLNRILEVDRESYTAVLEPGVVTKDFQDRVASQGLYYPPDPASAGISTLGGNVSTNAGGLRAVKYGVTRDYVLGLQAVLTNGEIINTGKRVFKNVVGLDMTSLLVGSEGTLAFFTKLGLKLLPLPEKSASVLLGFPDLDSLMQAAAQVFENSLTPVAMEFLDENTIFCLEKFGEVPWPKKCKVLLLLQFNGSRESVELELDSARSLSKKWNSKYWDVADTKEQEKSLWEIRRSISPAAFQMGSDKLSVDVTVPRGKVARAVSGIREISGKYGLYVLNFGHLGDGNIHVNVMYSADKNYQSYRANKLLEQVMRQVLELEGTISGEHGVGLLKRPYLGSQLGITERSLMKQIKQVFDPENILNPDKAI